MEFRIADTFTDSLGRLTAQEQKAVKTTAFDLQLNPSAPGHSFHRLDRALDPNFWSVRVNADIRIIVHRANGSILLVYVDHHDDAYRWAARRKIERHPTTGAMQLVELKATEELAVHRYRIPAHSDDLMGFTYPETKLFDNLRKFELMALGVPEVWVNDVRNATEETLFEVISHLPQEAQEALLSLAVGEQPRNSIPVVEGRDPFEHPDAKRRFRVVTSAEDLRLALEFPWEKWTVFLHPSQRAIVEGRFGGPARVSGSAGTGKTIVALHRAAFLARINPSARVLLTTFSKPLANALRQKLTVLLGQEPDVLKRIDVKALSAFGYDLYSQWYGQPHLAPPTLVRSLLAEAAASIEGHKFNLNFLLGEWQDVVDAWQLRDWESYRDVARLGRKTRIGGRQREQLWSIFARLREKLAERKVVTWSDVFGRLSDGVLNESKVPFGFVVVDECQDLGVAEARFLGVCAGSVPDGLFLAGDLGQRIFQQPFSWRALGLDVRGRSSTLRINYRTSHQIRSQADRLLPSVVSDVDGLSESRKGTVSLFDGPSPEVLSCDSPEDEISLVSDWITQRLAEGCLPHEIGIFVRSSAELKRARVALKQSGARFVELGEKAEGESGCVSVATMHNAKGLEFRSVVVMCCDDEVIPLQERIEEVSDDADLEEVYETERHLLYVACTRARDHLLISGVEPVSEFLDDLLIRSQAT